jgi:hypothetical protein
MTLIDEETSCCAAESVAGACDEDARHGMDLPSARHTLSPHGSLAAIAAIPAGTTVPAATAFNTIDLKLYLLRSVLPADGELVARTTVAHRGRTIAIANCEVTGPDGALVAQATGFVLILPGRGAGCWRITRDRPRADPSLPRPRDR